MASIFAEEMPTDLCDLIDSANDKPGKTKQHLVTQEAFWQVHEASRLRFGLPQKLCNVMDADREQRRSAVDVCELFRDASPVKIIAPMVKYSSYVSLESRDIPTYSHRAEFRALCRAYGCQVGYCPMIIAEDVIKSGNWTRADLFAVEGEQALVAQFAANDVSELVQCSQSVYWGCDGIDINLGCPQKFALRRRFGAALLEDFQLVTDMVRSVRQANPTSDEKPFSVSVKIRIMPNLRKTIDLCQKAEHAGVSYITVHGRYPHQKDHGVYPADWNAIRMVKDAVNIPVVANGDVHTIEDYNKVSGVTDCDGVMIANGLLANPALFLYDETPMECILRWFSLFGPLSLCTFAGPEAPQASFGSPKSSQKSSDVIETAAPFQPLPANNDDTSFVTFHNHLIHMVPFANKREKSIFASLANRFEIAYFFMHEWHRASEFKAFTTSVLGTETTN